MRNRFVCAAIVILHCGAFAIAADAPAKAPAGAASPATTPALDPRLIPPARTLEVKDGDTVVFLGDSITHQCLYTQYVEDFFYTRFPKLRIRFHNAGVGGDGAAAALARFDDDVAAYKPRYVTVLLGMNDGAYKQWDVATFDAYQKDMLKLLDRIKEIGATAVVMGPTMFDRDAMLIKGNKAGFESEMGRNYNAVMAYYGAFMRDQALERGLNYVDMFAPLNQLTMDRRMQDPNFTMIPDGVHPDPNGHTVMAVALLDALGLPRSASITTAAFEAGTGWKVNISRGGKISDIQGDAEHLSFTSAEPTLPWVLPPDTETGFRLTSAGHQFSSLALSAVGLAAGNYELKIDGQSVGSFTSGMLAVRIELQGNPKCPQFQLALAISNLNKEKTEKTVRPIRDLFFGEKLTRLAKNSTPASIAAFVEQKKTKVTDLEKLQAAYEDKIQDAAQPTPHHFEFIKSELTAGDRQN